MSNKFGRKTDPDQPLVYQIRIEGYLGNQWADSFGGLTISHETPTETILTGPVTDQAALFGILARIRDLGLTLLAVTRVEEYWLDSER